MELRKNVSKPKEEFGPLAGVRVINAGSSIAGPFATSLMADWGADVIWVENPKVPELTRGNLSPQDNRRNQRNISLDIRSEEGREVLLKLVETADIYVESNKGGTYDKWGLTDEVLWEVNPKLVIFHLSGFGQYGDPNYYTRPSYDVIGQAFSCYLAFNGYPDRAPVAAMPWTGDFIPPLLGCAACLAALYRARETGEGESIDLAQYEALLRVQNSFPAEYMNLGSDIKDSSRPGDRSFYAGWGTWKCKDGYVYMCPMGTSGMKGLFTLLNLTDPEKFPEKCQWLTIADAGYEEVNKGLEEFLPTKTMAELDEEFTALGIAVSPVMTYADAVKHPHYIARENFTEWDAIGGPFENGKVKGVNITPKFKKHPGKIVRGCVTAGYDNEEILGELGYNEEQIQALYDAKAIAKSDVMHWGIGQAAKND